MLQCFDGAAETKDVGGSLHCAFVETRDEGGRRVRESIEVEL